MKIKLYIIFLISICFPLLISGVVDLEYSEINFVFRNIRKEYREITFIDKRLENSIREIIQKSKGPIFLSDINNIEKLDLRNKNISNLKGLENFTNLKDLNLAHNQITDISPLKNLTSLTKLDLSYNNIEDISPLEKIVKNNEIKELVIIPGNSFKVSDATKLSEWSRGGKNKEAAAELSKNLINLGFEVKDYEGEGIVYGYTDGFYEIKEKNGKIEELKVGDKLVINNPNLSLKLNEVEFKGDKLVIKSEDKVITVSPNGTFTTKEIE